MTLTIGLAGCGQLGGAIGRALLRTGFVRPDQLWIANRSGDRAAFADRARAALDGRPAGAR